MGSYERITAKTYGADIGLVLKLFCLPWQRPLSKKVGQAISNVFDMEVKTKGFSISKIKHMAELTNHLERRAP